MEISTLNAIAHDRELKWLPIDSIKPNPKNPRQEASFTEENLSRLRNSMRTHGVLEPLIVIPDSNDPKSFRLIEGERRYRSAILEGIKELPVVVVSDLDEHSQVVTMFNIHQNRKAWEMAEELAAVKELVERNGQNSDAVLAAELGMGIGTFRERLSVLRMGSTVLDEIATDKVQYSAALRSGQAAATIKKHRPKLVQKMGGSEAVEEFLLDKARTRKRGISAELVHARRDLMDTGNVPDEAVEDYLREPAKGWREVLLSVKPAEDNRKVREMSKRLAEVEREIRAFDPQMLDPKQLSELRRNLVSLMVAGQDLEERIVDTLLTRN